MQTSRFLDTGFNQTGPAPFLYIIPMGQKIELLLNMNLKKLCQNCYSILEIATHKTLTKTNIHIPFWISVLRSHNTATNVYHNLRLNCFILTIGKTYTQPSDSSYSCSRVCLEPVTSCRYHNIVKWRHHFDPQWISMFGALSQN